MTQLDHHHIDQLIDEAHEILHQLTNGIPTDNGRTPNIHELLRRDRQARHDGLHSPNLNPTRTHGDTDHIGNLVAANLDSRDPIHHQQTTTLRGLTSAIGDLRLARDTLAKAFQPQDLRPAEPGCANHNRHGHWEPIHTNGRCRWCYDFWLNFGLDAPAQLIQARAEGRRITQPMVDQAIADTKHPRPRRTRLSRR